MTTTQAVVPTPVVCPVAKKSNLSIGFWTLVSSESASSLMTNCDLYDVIYIENLIYWSGNGEVHRANSACEADLSCNNAFLSAIQSCKTKGVQFFFSVSTGFSKLEKFESASAAKTAAQNIHHLAGDYLKDAITGFDMSGLFAIPTFSIFDYILDFYDELRSLQPTWCASISVSYNVLPFIPVNQVELIKLRPIDILNVLYFKFDSGASLFKREDTQNILKTMYQSWNTLAMTNGARHVPLVYLSDKTTGIEAKSSAQIFLNTMKDFIGGLPSGYSLYSLNVAAANDFVFIVRAALGLSIPETTTLSHTSTSSITATTMNGEKSTTTTSTQEAITTTDTTGMSTTLSLTTEENTATFSDGKQTTTSTTEVIVQSSTTTNVITTTTDMASTTSFTTEETTTSAITTATTIGSTTTTEHTTTDSSPSPTSCSLASKKNLSIGYWGTSLSDPVFALESNCGLFDIVYLNGFIGWSSNGNVEFSVPGCGNSDQTCQAQVLTTVNLDPTKQS
jgi:hypothetical protein